MRKNEIPQNFTLSLFPFGLGIGFASLAHPCLGFLCKKQERCRVFLVLFSGLKKKVEGMLSMVISEYE